MAPKRVSRSCSAGLPRAARGAVGYSGYSVSPRTLPSLSYRAGSESVADARQLVLRPLDLMVLLHLALVGEQHDGI
jgi:hypothetical protein